MTTSMTTKGCGRWLWLALALAASVAGLAAGDDEVLAQAVTAAQAQAAAAATNAVSPLEAAQALRTEKMRMLMATEEAMRQRREALIVSDETCKAIQSEIKDIDRQLAEKKSKLDEALKKDVEFAALWDKRQTAMQAFREASEQFGRQLRSGKSGEAAGGTASGASP